MIERNPGTRSAPRHPALVAIGMAGLVSLSCAGRGPVSALALGGPAAASIAILDPSRSFEEGWEPIVLSGETRYELAFTDDRLALHALADDSASGLIRKIRIDPADCPIVEWSWRVDRLHEGADLHAKAKDDVAASIFFLFGNPEAGFGVRRVPTIRYVWTNGTSEENEVVDNPYLPGTVRSIVVRSGATRLGHWKHEHRDLAEDFRYSFGREPDDVVEAVALFTDSDQTHESVEAWYGGARALCSPDEAPEEEEEEDGPS